MWIDAHLHVWRAIPSFSSKARPVATAVSPTTDVPLALVEQYMAEYGVDRAALIQPVFPGEDNSYVADCAAQAPERFVAVCVVDPRLSGAADRLAYWVRERGCKGLRLRPRIADESACFGAPETYPLWERARDLGVVVSLLANPEHLATAGRLAERYPQVPIVLDHMAHPDVAAGVAAPSFQALLALARFANVFIKPSGFYYFAGEPYPYTDCVPYLKAVYNQFGAGRLIWGSDFPHVLLKTGFRRALLFQERIYPSYFAVASGDLDRIMGGNAASLYWRT